MMATFKDKDTIVLNHLSYALYALAIFERRPSSVPPFFLNRSSSLFVVPQSIPPALTMSKLVSVVQQLHRIPSSPRTPKSVSTTSKGRDAIVLTE